MNFTALSDRGEEIGKAILVICELKAVEGMKALFTDRLLTQLRLADKRLVFLINFNAPVIKDGINHLIL